MIYFIVLQIGYLIVRHVLRWSNGTSFLFDLIKEQVFTIAGSCQHSGRCCSSIMLYDDAAPINVMDDWLDFLKQHPQYQSFKPNHDHGVISSFDCSCLTSDQRCGQYEYRPSICRQYPTSFFFQHGFIYDSCGYYVERNHTKFNWLFPSIRFQLNAFSSS